MAQPALQDPYEFLKGSAPVASSGGGGSPAPQDPYEFLGTPEPAGAQPAAVPQETGPMRYVDLAGKAIAEGGIRALGLPGDIQALGIAGANRVRGLLGYNPVNLPPFLPTSEQTANWLPATPSVQPQGAERLPYAALEGATTMALTRNPEAIVAGATGSTLSEGARELGLPSWAQTLAGFLGGIGGGLTAGRVRQGIEALGGKLNPNAAAMETAGVPQRSPALTSTDEATRKALAPYAPVDAVAQDLGNSVETSAQAIGSARTWQQAGEAAQAAARDWHDNILPGKLAAAWAPVDAAVTPTTPVNIDGFTSVLQRITGKAGQMQPLVDALSPRLPKQLLDKLDKVMTTPSGAPLAPENYPAVNWSDVQSLRSAIGDAMANPTLIKDIKQSDLANMYRALTNDMRGGISSSLGPDAAPTLEAFDNANVESSRLYKFGERVADKLANAYRPEIAAKSLFSGGRAGATDLAALRSEIPSAANEIAAAGIRQVGLDNPEISTSPVAKQFTNYWSDLSTASKEALVPDPSTRARLDAAAQVHENLKSLPKGGSGVSGAARLGHGIAGAGIGAGIEALWPTITGALPPGTSEALGASLAQVPLYLREAYAKAAANSPLMAVLEGATTRSLGVVGTGAAGIVGATGKGGK